MNAMNNEGIIASAPNIARMLSETIPVAPDAAELRARAQATLIGLAAGNLIGLPLEGAWHHSIADWHPDGVLDIDPDEKTFNYPMDDDLAQAVELGESLLDGGDLMGVFADRLVAWLDNNGRGCGHLSREVIALLANGTPPPDAARKVYDRLGGIAPNGSVMRCAPVAIARRADPDALVRDSAASCVATHYAASCQWSSVVFNAAVAMLLNGVKPDLPALYRAALADGAPDMAHIARADKIPSAPLDAAERGEDPPPNVDWLRVDQGLIGHTLLAMQAGLWATATPLGFEDALTDIVASGGDADTNGAVAGAALGARYGMSAIPDRWLDRIPQREYLAALADRLLQMN